MSHNKADGGRMKGAENGRGPASAENNGAPAYRKFIARLPEGEAVMEVARNGDGFRIRRGESEASLTWEGIDSGRTLLQVDGRPLEVRIQTAPDGTVKIEWRGHWFSVQMEDDLAARARAAKGQSSGPTALRSPMPGMVVSVLVEKGAQVALEQPVLILEAMKMQNELAAPIAGTVEELSVQPGQAVEGDQVLLRIRP